MRFSNMPKWHILRVRHSTMDAPQGRAVRSWLYFVAAPGTGLLQPVSSLAMAYRPGMTTLARTWWLGHLRVTCGRCGRPSVIEIDDIGSPR